VRARDSARINPRLASIAALCTMTLYCQALFALHCCHCIAVIALYVVIALLTVPHTRCLQAFCVFVSAEPHLLDQRLRQAGCWDEATLQLLLANAAQQQSAAPATADACVTNSSSLQHAMAQLEHALASRWPRRVKQQPGLLLLQDHATGASVLRVKALTAASALLRLPRGRHLLRVTPNELLQCGVSFASATSFMLDEPAGIQPLWTAAVAADAAAAAEKAAAAGQVEQRGDRWRKSAATVSSHAHAREQWQELAAALVAGSSCHVAAYEGEHEALAAGSLTVLFRWVGCRRRPARGLAACAWVQLGAPTAPPDQLPGPACPPPPRRYLLKPIEAVTVSMQLRASCGGLAAAHQLVLIDNATLEETRHVLNRPSGLKVRGRPDAQRNRCGHTD